MKSGKKGLKTGTRFKRVKKILFRVVIALGLSIALSIALIVYTPPIFTVALNTSLELLPEHKFVSYRVQSKSELAERWQLSTSFSNDDALLQALKQGLPESRDKSTFFARMFVVHDYPQPCQFMIFGLHRSIDISWQVEGLRCNSHASCEAARVQHICPERKRHDK
ncbi:hypothetical protein [Agarivorans sp. QJM3NY_33]|uniref:hypothetical protein n=1 Tax=Agarivorans sp. QJM3NY_33 TaxID=3421432 RepID=UPI003D7E4F3C